MTLIKTEISKITVSIMSHNIIILCIMTLVITTRNIMILSIRTQTFEKTEF
jgi:hypothetical protein